MYASKQAFKSWDVGAAVGDAVGDGVGDAVGGDVVFDEPVLDELVNSLCASLTSAPRVDTPSSTSAARIVAAFAEGFKSGDLCAKLSHTAQGNTHWADNMQAWGAQRPDERASDGLEPCYSSLGLDQTHWGKPRYRPQTQLDRDGVLYRKGV